MSKTILITGSTDGIGLETAKSLVADAQRVIIHGRTEKKLAATADLLSESCDCEMETFRADLSQLAEVEAFAAAVAERHSSLDVLINNAGVYSTSQPVTDDGYDVRFMVNTIAPYLLTQRLLPLIPQRGRVVNLSSAAQSPVNLDALAGKKRLEDGAAYAQSKLALTMWSFHLARNLGSTGPVIVAVNPASFLGSKMVKDAYGVAGHDLSIGADILFRAALSEEFADATGKYFDNDQGRFAAPHPDALDERKNEKVVAAIETAIADLTT